MNQKASVSGELRKGSLEKITEGVKTAPVNIIACIHPVEAHGSRCWCCDGEVCVLNVSTITIIGTHQGDAAWGVADVDGAVSLNALGPVGRGVVATKQGQGLSWIGGKAKG
jgi:hypothetical protein